MIPFSDLMNLRKLIAVSKREGMRKNCLVAWVLIPSESAELKRSYEEELIIDDHFFRIPEAICLLLQLSRKEFTILLLLSQEAKAFLLTALASLRTHQQDHFFKDTFSSAYCLSFLMIHCLVTSSSWPSLLLTAVSLLEGHHLVSSFLMTYLFCLLQSASWYSGHLVTSSSDLLWWSQDSGYVILSHIVTSSSEKVWGRTASAWWILRKLEAVSKREGLRKKCLSLLDESSSCHSLNLLPSLPLKVPELPEWFIILSLNIRKLLFCLLH